MSVLKTYAAGVTYAPSQTFCLRNGHIEGMIDGLEAVRQSLELILSTERFYWPIFSADYGVELDALIGERRQEYAAADLKRRISEALTEDDRVTEIRDFAVTFDREVAHISLTAITTLGSVNLERGMQVG